MSLQLGCLVDVILVQRCKFGEQSVNFVWTLTSQSKTDTVNFVPGTLDASLLIRPYRPSQKLPPDSSYGLKLNMEADEATDTHTSREDQPLLRAPDEEAWSPPRFFLWIEAAIMANVFLNGFDITITASTYAVISSHFGASNLASWLTTSYLVTSTAFLPLYGRFSDIFGRRICFFVSTITFSLGCLGCGASGSMIFLIGMRAFTGLGGAGLMTMGSYFLSSFKPRRTILLYIYRISAQLKIANRIT
jgi:Major Facilitator Superfamily